MRAAQHTSVVEHLLQLMASILVADFCKIGCSPSAATHICLPKHQGSARLPCRLGGLVVEVCQHLMLGRSL